MQTRYHIQLNNRRTTILLDTVLSELLAAKLTSPGDGNKQSVVRMWLQEAIRDGLGDNLPTNSRVSQHARRFAIEAIAEPVLMDRVISERIE